MKRQELIAMLVEKGMEKDVATSVADSILAEHTSGTNELRSKLEEKDTELNSLRESNKALESELGTNKEQLAVYQANQEKLEALEKDKEALEVQLSMSNVRTDVLQEVMAKNPINAEDVMRFIDIETVAQAKDVKEETARVVKELVESKDYLFQKDLVQGGYDPAKSTGKVPPLKSNKELSYEEQVAEHYKQLAPKQSNASNPLNVQE